MQRRFRNCSIIGLMLFYLTILMASNRSGYLKLKTAFSQNHDTWTVQQTAQSQSDSGAVIKGTLFNLDSEDVKSALLIAWAENGPDIDDRDSLLYKSSSVVDEDGNYEIRGLATGDYYVQASADNFETLYYDNTESLSDAIVIRIQSNETIENIDFEMIRILPGTGVISGKVTNEDDGHPVACANVTLFSTTSWYTYGTITDANGEYRFNELKPDTFYIYAATDGFLMEYYDSAYSDQNATKIIVTDSSQISDVDFQLGHGGTISGTVTDSSYLPLEGVCMQAMTQLQGDSLIWIDVTYPEKYYSAVTDSSGKYAITGLQDGTYFIRGQNFQPWGSNIAFYPGVTDPDDAVPVDISNHNEVTHIDFQIFVHLPDGVIEGAVTDKNGNPVTDARISLGSYPPWRSFLGYWGSAVTNETGHYRLENIPEDTYIVQCTIDDPWNYLVYYWPGTANYEEATPMEITAEHQIHENINFQLPVTFSQAEISGKVLAADGHPLAFASIQIKPGENTSQDLTYPYWKWLWAVTDENGMYHVDHVPAGSYTASCEYWENEAYAIQYYDHKDAEDQATILTITETSQLDDIDFDLALHPLYGSLKGIVLNQDKLPLANAYVETIPDDASMTLRPYIDWMSLSSCTTTDENGEYHFPKLYHDQYRVAAYANGGYAFYPDAIVWENATPVTVSGGDSASADFTLQITEYTASISGQISAGWNGWYSPVTDSGSAYFGMPSLIDSVIFVVTAKPTITILSYPESERVYTAVTALDGNYTLNCPPGEYTIQAFSADYLPEYYDNAYDLSKAKIVKTSTDNPAKDVDLNLSPKLYWRNDSPTDMSNQGNRIYGCIKDDSGQAVSGATIYLLNANGQPLFSVMSDESGEFEIMGMPSGDYFIQANKAGFESVFNGNVKAMNNAQALTIDQTEEEILLTLSTASAVPDNSKSLPEDIRLEGNYPNPFNPCTQIRFSLPGNLHIKLTIYNALGQKLAQIAEGEFTAGEHQIDWKGMDQYGNTVPSGLYFYRLEAGDKIQTRKMILMR